MSSKLLTTLFCLIFAASLNAQGIKEQTLGKKDAKIPQKIQINADKNISGKGEKIVENVKETVNNQQAEIYQRPDAEQRFKRYVKSVVGPWALTKSVVSAGYGTARNSPEEWEGNIEGFGKRFASSIGKKAIKQTTIYGLDEALKLDSKFYRSEKRDFGSRLKNALLSPVTARNERGKRVLGVPRIAGTYTSSIISRETWYPERYDYKDGLRSGTISFGTGALINIFKEFVLK